MELNLSPVLQELIQALRYLPGIGPKSAQRIAFYLLQNNLQKTKQLASTIHRCVTEITTCQQCRMLTEQSLCRICSNTKRNAKKICIVENPLDVLAIEQTATFSGRYFILMGNLSPIDSIGPDKIGIPLLLSQLKQFPIEEVILALSATVEGQTTSHYIANLIRTFPLTITRLAHGIPMGSELEYTDGHTLAHAFIDRKTFTLAD